MAIDDVRNEILIEQLAALLIQTALFEKLSGKHFTAEDVDYANTS